MGKKLNVEELELNMTPMIDVVFQLIIFFVVTLRMEAEVNKEIRLEWAPNGPAVKNDQAKGLMIIEVDSRGKVSMHGYRIDKVMLKGILQRRYNKQGEFPVMIRGDKKTQHKDIRSVMDLCTEVGLWRINFAAIKEQRM
jgi:biopolymer transport protein ExbD